MTASSRRVTVLQGEHAISRDPSVELSTILGSCIAACLHDPVRRIGGMNHFLLAIPGPGTAASRKDAERYGAYAMEVLINALIKRGSRRADLRAHVYGGANLHVGMQEIGEDNARFAIDFLTRDGIAISRVDIGGTHARRVDFRAASGQARSRMSGTAVPAPASPIAAAGDVELF